MFSKQIIKMGQFSLVFGPSLLFVIDILSPPISAAWAQDARMVNEECLPDHVERMIHCLEKNQVVNLRDYSCIDANRRQHCNEQERLVISINGECITTECRKNILEDGRVCPDNQLPFMDDCYDIDDDKPCQGRLHQTLQADLFGDVNCSCSDGFFLFNGECFPESSFLACGGSTGKQLIWNDDLSILQCSINICGPDKMMWRNASSENFLCVDFEESVLQCDDILDLQQGYRDNIKIHCGVSWRKFEFNSVIQSCNGSEIDSSGRCKPIGVNPTNKLRFKDLLRKACSMLSEDAMGKHCA